MALNSCWVVKSSALLAQIFRGFSMRQSQAIVSPWTPPSMKPCHLG
jgi:hypothetical protein